MLDWAIVMNLKSMLEQSAERYGEKTAVALGESRLSYLELEEASNKIANALLDMGVGRGDRVAILLANSPEFVAVYFGVVKAGAVAVLLDPKYKIGELTSLFSHCEPRVLVTESPYLEPLAPFLPSFKYVEHVVDLSAESDSRFLSYQAIMAGGSAQRIALAPEPEDVACIAYTSGPTFCPRGAMLTHAQLVRESEISADGFAQTADDILVLFALPLHHAIGLVVVLLASMGRGSTVIMVPGLSIAGLLETIEREGVTIFMGVPFVYALLLNKMEDEGLACDLSSLRLCASAGAPLPIDVSRRFERQLGMSLVQFYGLAEGAAHATCQDIDGSGKPGSVGRVLPGWEVKVVDDDGRELPPGQPGEVIMRGPIMEGYYQDPGATAEVIKEGWLYSGDFGRMDEDGQLFILGLKKDMIIVKGQNIYPSDIEMVLSAHSRVAEVAVAGIPDEMRGEVVGVAIKLKPGETATEAEIKKFCLERVANYKVPKKVIFLSTLPKTSNGKVDKGALKKQLLVAYLAGEAERDLVS